mmetsp:Transcript_9720/g.41299  ORF Transcript_9720/g.41299 Transcript_9720/m.41299 type:complete len:226 (+) Transcript_9720:637-1314(+)
MADLTHASAPAAGTGCVIVSRNGDEPSSRHKATPLVVPAHHSNTAASFARVSLNSSSPHVANAMRSKHRARASALRFGSALGSQRNASSSNARRSSGARMGAVDGFSKLFSRCDASSSSSKYMARSFRVVSASACADVFFLFLKSSAAWSRSPTTVAALASASDAARSGATRRTTPAPCASAAAARSSCETRVANALDCVARDVSPPSPASPPFARSASIICANR